MYRSRLRTVQWVGQMNRGVVIHNTFVNDALEGILHKQASWKPLPEVEQRIETYGTFLVN